MRSKYSVGLLVHFTKVKTALLKFSPISSKRFATLVLLFYLCFFLLLSSGRVASGDAGQQLQATMLLVHTGSLGTKTPPGRLESGWVPNSKGYYYQPHDIGNIALMFPSALLGSLVSKEPAATQIETPPIISRLAVSLTYACLSAIGCFFMFRFFNLYYKPKTSFFLSLAFATTTIFWAYTKAAWDVMGACCFVCTLLYFSGKVLLGQKTRQSVILAGAALAVVGSFRFSLVPFLILGLAAVLYYSRRSLTLWNYVACTATFLLGMLPSFFYNYVRMGSLLRPATTAPQYLEGNNAITGNLVEGFFGLLFAPNRGLFIYSPIFLLLFVLPLAWRKIPLDQRHLMMSYGISAVLYLLLIAKLKYWGTFGWGPRYLLPIVPILFFPVGCLLVMFWNQYRRRLIGLLSLSFLLSIAPVIVNWHLVTTEFPQASNPYAWLPQQQIGAWNGILRGLQGQSLPVPPDIASDPIRSRGARFPDLWTVRLMEQSKLGFVVGLSLSIFLAFSTALTLQQLMKR